VVQKKKILKVEPFDDIHIIGINTTNRDYKLAWHLNNELKTDLSKEADIAVPSPNSEAQTFPFYYYHAGENQNIFNLIGNRSSDSLFTSMKTKTDFFLIIRNSITAERVSEIIQSIKRIPGVQLAYKIKPANEKNIDWMLEHIELHEFETMREERKRLRLPRNTSAMKI
jgi:hypothetical protein